MYCTRKLYVPTSIITCILVLALLFTGSEVLSDYETAATVGATPHSLTASVGTNPNREEPRSVATPAQSRGQLDTSADRFWDLYGNGNCELTVFGDDQEDCFAVALSTGDVNGDGIHDLLVGVEGDDGPGNVRSGCGAVLVYYGGSHLASDSLTATNADVYIYGPDASDGFGTALVCADVNDDDTLDIVIGAQAPDGYANSTTGTGEVRIIFGSNALPTEIDLNVSSDVTIWGESASGGASHNQAGAMLASGDINGDLIDDIILHSHGGDLPDGSVEDATLTFVMYGRATWAAEYFLDTDYDIRIWGVDEDDGVYTSGTTTKYRGTNTVASGDVNCDGFDDVMIVLPGADGQTNSIGEAGECRVVFGGSSLPSDIKLTDNTDVVIYNEDVDDHMLEVFSFDVNNDDWNDIVFSSRSGDGPDETRTNAGEFGVVFGSTTLDTAYLAQSQADLMIFNRDSDDRAHAVCAADIDGDGIGELICVAYAADGPDNLYPECGDAFVFTRPDTLPPRVDMATAEADVLIFSSGDDYKSGVFPTVCEDVTGDGVPDIILGAYVGVNDVGITTGRLRMIDGVKFYESDTDLDAVVDVCDNCPGVANPQQEDIDIDGIGDICDECIDPDGDGFGTPGYPVSTCDLDNCPDDYNPGQADADGDGIGDVCDMCCNNPGDANHNGSVDISDLTYYVDYLFAGGPGPVCMEEFDNDGNCSADISDLTYFVDYLFGGGPAPVACHACE